MKTAAIWARVSTSDQRDLSLEGQVERCLAKLESLGYLGPPMLEGPEGQLVELALAIGKERSVERAQQGARDGLRDRAKLKGLPTTRGNPYGYCFDETRKPILATG